MAIDVLANGKNSEILALANAVVSGQSTEIETLKPLAGYIKNCVAPDVLFTVRFFFGPRMHATHLLTTAPRSPIQVETTDVLPEPDHCSNQRHRLH